jgi:hypothetical protein
MVLANIGWVGRETNCTLGIRSLRLMTGRFWKSCQTLVRVVRQEPSVLLTNPSMIAEGIFIQALNRFQRIDFFVNA